MWGSGRRSSRSSSGCESPPPVPGGRAESGVCGETVSPEAQPLSLWKGGPSFACLLQGNLGVTGQFLGVCLLCFAEGVVSWKSMGWCLDVV